MKEEYLWDKSGEPDPEIQELEEILGSLRYQPRKFQLKDDLRPNRRRNYLSLISIAATLVMALLAGFLWLSLKPSQHNETAVVPPVTVTPTPVTIEKKKDEEVVQKDKPNRQLEAVAVNRHRRGSSRPGAATQEAVLAKEQLMTALRLASEKLNLAQRKAQNPSLNQIRNQHKNG
jgi:hypothetical protein